MFLFPRPNNFYVCLKHSDWNRCTDRSPFGYMDHSKYFPRNQLASPCQSTLSMNEKDVINCCSIVSDSLK